MSATKVWVGSSTQLTGFLIILSQHLVELDKLEILYQLNDSSVE